MANVSYFCCWLFLSTLSVSVVAFPESRSIIDTIMATVNQARTYFDTAKDVANLVSQSLKGKFHQRRMDAKPSKVDEEHTFLKHSFIGGFFRMLRLDSSKIFAIAVNSVIFLAQLISTLFDVKTSVGNSSEDKDIPKWDPMKYIVEHKNDRIKRLVQQAQDPDLPNHLIEHVNSLDSSCVQLLLCKTSPIIWAAQKSLKNKSVFKDYKLTTWLPSWHEFENYSDICEEKHTDCIIFPDI